MKVLVIGGMGYVGSHTVVELANSGCECIVADNYSRDWRGKLGRMQKISEYPIDFTTVDLTDPKEMMDLFARHKFNAVVYVHEWNLVEARSENPLFWHEKSMLATTVLLQVMEKAGVTKILFSSPIRQADLSETVEWNPYERTNAMIEEMLRERFYKTSKWRVSLLNYSLPFGAHPSGMIGYEVTGHTDNFITSLMKVAKGERKRLHLLGTEELFDFIHVMDIAKAHYLGLTHLIRHAGHHHFVANTGQRHSRIAIIQAFEEASGVKIPYRRSAKQISIPSKASQRTISSNSTMHWTAEHGLSKMCEDAWRWENAFKRLVVLD